MHESNLQYPICQEVLRHLDIVDLHAGLATTGVAGYCTLLTYVNQELVPALQQVLMSLLHASRCCCACIAPSLTAWCALAQLKFTAYRLKRWYTTPRRVDMSLSHLCGRFWAFRRCQLRRHPVHHRHLRPHCHPGDALSHCHQLNATCNLLDRLGLSQDRT